MPETPAFRPPVLSYEDIRQRATEFLHEYCEPLEVPVPIESIVEFDLAMDVIPKLGLESSLDVAAFLSSDLEYIYVDEATMKHSVERYRFSLAHEVGHYWLHDAFYRQHPIGSIEDFKTAQRAISEDYKWFEFHANSFAGLVLVPPVPLRAKFEASVAAATASGIRQVQLIEHPLRQRLVRSVASAFTVSEPVAERRLEKDGFLPKVATLE